jgi:hypothetical protein
VVEAPGAAALHDGPPLLRSWSWRTGQWRRMYVSVWTYACVPPVCGWVLGRTAHLRQRARTPWPFRVPAFITASSQWFHAMARQELHVCTCCLTLYVTLGESPDVSSLSSLLPFSEEIISSRLSDRTNAEAAL